MIYHQLIESTPIAALKPGLAAARIPELERGVGFTQFAGRHQLAGRRL
jgi:hypothetical protein